MSSVTMEEWILKRTGNAPIRIFGEAIAESEAIDKDGIRKYEAIIVKGSDGLYAWSVAFDTTWVGEMSHTWSGFVTNPILVPYAMRSFNPIPPRAGFPPGEKYAAKQANYIKEYTALFLKCIEAAIVESGIADKQPSDIDPKSIIWNKLRDIPELGTACVLKMESGELLNAVPQESARVEGQLSWNIGTTIAYDTPEIVAWGYVDE